MVNVNPALIDKRHSSQQEFKTGQNMNSLELSVKQFFRILGGESSEFPDETTDRVLRFKSELANKRAYIKFTTFKTDTDEMIIINGLKLFSFCEHHLLPFFGYGSIGYIPDGKILGLSKFQRLVDKVSSKPTLQEDITNEIANMVQKTLSPKGIGVAFTCIHACMFGRGINTSTCSVNTQVLKGLMKDEHDTRAEFLQRINIENILR